VIGLGAVVGAVALSAAKSSVERKRQLDKRRADAAKAVRGLTDEFQLVLTKQIRDAVRTVQHELRRVTAAAVAELTPALAEELDTVRASVETARRAPTELVAIAEDLDAVADLRERALELRRLTDGEPGADPGRRSPLTVVA
jgi:gas vesicle protein